MEGSTETKSQRKGMQARSAATKRLQDAHMEEWEDLLREEREARGLFGVPKRVTIADMQKQLDAALARLKELESQQ